MKIKRREFLSTAVASTAGSLVIGDRLQATPIDTNPTAVVPLGKTLKVARIGLGTGMRAWEGQSNQTRMGQDKFNTLIHYALDRGVRLFDAADLYGSHSYFAKALKGKPRESYTISTKIWWRKNGLASEERPDADIVVQRFLKELQTDYIDLVQLHCATNPKWPEELRKQMDILERLKEKGQIRAHGVTCHSIGALEAAVKEPWVDAIHVRINPFKTKMDGDVKKVVAIVERLHQAGKGIIGMKVLGEGTFANDPKKREESVRFLLGLKTVDTMVVGFESPQQIDTFVEHVQKVLSPS